MGVQLHPLFRRPCIRYDDDRRHPILEYIHLKEKNAIIFPIFLDQFGNYARCLINLNELELTFKVRPRQHIKKKDFILKKWPGFLNCLQKDVR